MRTTLLRPAAALLAAGLIAAACGGGTSGSGTSTDTSGGGGSDMSGSINIQGSSTVEPVSARVAELFQGNNPGVAVQVGGPGTGTGFKDFFCVGESDISDASRQIKDSELELCEQNGITDILELRVGIDGLTVLTSTENDAVECLGYGDLYALLGPESTGFDSWADGNAIRAELAAENPQLSNGELPDVELVTAGPGTESGTYDSFIELVMEGLAEERGQDNLIRNDWSGNANDNVIIQSIGGNTTSLGWVGYAFFANNAGAVDAIDVKDPESGDCVTPTDETIASGAYPLSRSLYIYVNMHKVDQSPALAAFVDFFLSETGRAQVSGAGYVQLTDEAWAETVAAWEAARA